MCVGGGGGGGVNLYSLPKSAKCMLMIRMSLRTLLQILSLIAKI